MYQPHYGYMPMGPAHMPQMMCMPPYSGPVYINHHYGAQHMSAQLAHPTSERAFQKAFEKQRECRSKIQISESQRKWNAVKAPETDESVANLKITRDDLKDPIHNELIKSRSGFKINESRQVTVDSINTKLREDSLA